MANAKILFKKEKDPQSDLNRVSRIIPEKRYCSRGLSSFAEPAENEAFQAYMPKGSMNLSHSSFNEPVLNISEITF